MALALICLSLLQAIRRESPAQPVCSPPGLLCNPPTPPPRQSTCGYYSSLKHDLGSGWGWCGGRPRWGAGGECWTGSLAWAQLHQCHPASISSSEKKSNPARHEARDMKVLHADRLGYQCLRQVTRVKQVKSGSLRA